MWCSSTWACDPCAIGLRRLETTLSISDPKDVIDVYENIDLLETEIDDNLEEDTAAEDDDTDIVFEIPNYIYSTYDAELLRLQQEYDLQNQTLSLENVTTFAIG